MASIQLGLPKRLLPQPEASLSEGCTSQMTRVFPNNISSVSASATLSTAIASYTQPTFTVQECRFSIPAGMGKNVFVDVSKSRLNFRAKYVNTADTSGTWATFLNSSAYSYFDRIQHFGSNGQIIDDVNGLAQIMCHRNNFEFDASERDSMWQYGFVSEAAGTGSQNLLQGHAIDALTGATPDAQTDYYDYSVPLPSSLLGGNARNFVPIGAINKLDISLWTNAVMPISYKISSAASSAAVTLTLTLDNISIDLQYVYLDQVSASLLNMGKEYYVHSITNRLSTGTIAASTTGQVSTLIGLRGRSVRSLATRFSQNVGGTAGSANGSFDSQLVQCTSLNYFLNGKDRVPAIPHNTVYAPSTVFEHCLQAAENFSPDKTKYGGTFDSFGIAVAASAFATASSKWTTLNTRTTQVGTLSTFAFAEDLRVVSTSSILDGANLSIANNFLELNIAQANTNALNVSFISAMDIIYVVDFMTGQIESRV